MNILAISGSLNPASANSALLRAAAAQATAPVALRIWDDLAALPYFSPGAPDDDAVGSLRTRVADADAVWMSTPEYAGGMPGALKNALDWLVGSGELYGKPIVITSAAPSLERGHNARRWIQEVVRMQGASVVDSFTVAIPPGTSDAQLATCVDTALRRVVGALETAQREDLAPVTSGV